MAIGIVGRKCGMTRVFDENGVSTPVTVIEVAPNRITQVKTQENDGYQAIQITTGEVKANRVNAPKAGHFKKAGVEAGRGLWEFRTDSLDGFEAGGEIKVDIFENGQIVDVTNGGIVLGTATIVDGEVVFTPGENLQTMNDGENQDVSFEYTVSDENGETDTSTVTVNVTGSTDETASAPTLSVTIGDAVVTEATEAVSTDPVDVNITNASFESKDLKDGGYTYGSDASDGWTHSGGGYAGEYNLKGKDVHKDEVTGENVGYLENNGSTMSQTLSETLSENTTYSFNIDVGDTKKDDHGSSNNFSIKLYAGDVLIGEINKDDVNTENGRFETGNITVDTSTLGADFSGFDEALTIKITNNDGNHELLVDNLSMTKTANEGTDAVEATTEYALNIDTALTDSSESLSITVEDLPDGATLSAGIENADGSWTLTPSQLVELKLVTTSEVSSDFKLTVTSTSTGGASVSNSIDVHEVVDNESSNPTVEIDISDERLRTFIKRVRVKTSKELVDNASGQGYSISINNV